MRGPVRSGQADPVAGAEMRTGRGDLAGNGEHFATQLQREVGGDQRARALAGFDDHRGETEPRDDPVPRGEPAPRLERRFPGWNRIPSSRPPPPDSATAPWDGMPAATSRSEAGYYSEQSRQGSPVRAMPDNLDFGEGDGGQAAPGAGPGDCGNRTVSARWGGAARLPHSSTSPSSRAPCASRPGRSRPVWASRNRQDATKASGGLRGCLGPSRPSVRLRVFWGRWWAAGLRRSAAPGPASYGVATTRPLSVEVVQLPLLPNPRIVGKLW
jgi:hypothetical protein